MRFLLFLFVSISLSFGQTFEVKDRNGVPVVTVDIVKMFDEGTPEFEAAVTNVSGADLTLASLNVTVRKTDGTTADFSLVKIETGAGYRWMTADHAQGICNVCEFRKDATLKVTHAFTKPWPYTRETFESVLFSLPNSFVSPEDKRRLAKRQAQTDAAEGARRKRLAAEQGQKDAEERRNLRANCTTIYQNTIDKKVRDLTVREEEQVRACQVLGLYPPR